MIKETLTVGELIEALQEMPQDHKVYWYGGDKREKISDVVDVGDVVDLYNYEGESDEILIEEVARIALEDRAIRNYIGHQLDVSDEELEKAFQYLESKLNEGESDE